MTTRDEGGQKRATRSTKEVEEVEDLDTGDVQERHEKLTDDVDDILVGAQVANIYPVALNSFAFLCALLELEAALGQQAGGAGGVGYVVERAH